LQTESSREAVERAAPIPKAVIFDIGRVIVRLDPKRALQPIVKAIHGRGEESAKVLSAEDAWERIRADQRWHDWQEGRISSAEWHRHLMERLGISVGFEEFRKAWNLVIDPELILDDAFFERLSARCRLALLSNTDPIHVEHLEQRFSFWRHFPVRIYSCRAGMSKPSPAIYKAALESLEVTAREAVYVDDIGEFIGAARQMGLDSIQFQTKELLESELRRRHLC
jgi:FMN phosphatase YigB (HAD superfamily)